MLTPEQIRGMVLRQLADGKSRPERADEEVRALVTAGIIAIERWSLQQEDQAQKRRRRPARPMHAREFLALQTQALKQLTDYARRHDSLVEKAHVDELCQSVRNCVSADISDLRTEICKDLKTWMEPRVTKHWWHPMLDGLIAGPVGALMVIVLAVIISLFSPIVRKAASDQILQLWPTAATEERNSSQPASSNAGGQPKLADQPQRSAAAPAAAKP